MNEIEMDRYLDSLKNRDAYFSCCMANLRSGRLSEYLCFSNLYTLEFDYAMKKLYGN